MIFAYLILVVASILIIVDMALSTHKYAEMLQETNGQAPNNTVYRIMDPIVTVFRAKTAN